MFYDGHSVESDPRPEILSSGNFRTLSPKTLNPLLALMLAIVRCLRLATVSASTSADGIVVVVLGPVWARYARTTRSLFQSLASSNMVSVQGVWYTESLRQGLV